MTLSLLAGCKSAWLDESEHPMPEGVGGKAEFVFDGEPAVKVGKLGGDYSTRVKANRPWLVESTDEWIVVTSGRIGKGDGTEETINFTVTKNPSLNPRSGKIRMWITNDDEAFISISQDPLELSDLGTDYYVKPEGKADADGLSWETATTLSKALEASVNADKIHIAAGEYVPTDILPGGSEGDETFFVKSNISLIGGYPANPKAGDVADPAKNQTVLSGDDKAIHVLAIGAPKDDLFSVHVTGITITKGNSNGSGSYKINGATFYKNNGGGLLIGGSRVLLENCIITGNAGKANGGLFNAEDSETTFKNCEFSSNTGANGACIWNFAGTLNLINCLIKDNKGTGVGAGVYNYANGGILSKLYMAGCEVANNSAGASQGGAIYAREGSESILVNCTVYGNSCKKAAGVAIYGTASAPATLTMISCTVTGNSATASEGGGVEALNANATFNMYNSIVAGNTSVTEGAEDVVGQGAKVGSLPKILRASVIGGKAYSEGDAVSGTFASASMLGALSGGVFPLIGASNPALTGGMSSSDLKAVPSGVSFDANEEDLIVDQKGNARTEKVMGAYVGK